jgi:hypothetical protein
MTDKEQVALWHAMRMVEGLSQRDPENSRLRISFYGLEKEYREKYGNETPKAGVQWNA